LTTKTIDVIMLPGEAKAWPSENKWKAREAPNIENWIIANKLPQD
jgi:hypothetical protein